MTSYVVYNNPSTGEKLEVEAPLDSRIDAQELQQELGLPQSVDPSESFQLTKAIVVLWASRHPGRFVDSGSPVKIALFGGGAFKLHCPSASRPGPLFRRVGDLDFIVLREEAETVVRILTSLDGICGRMFFHTLTSSDKMFNKMRAGARYRLHAINDLNDHGEPIVGVVDLLCDELRFCHTLKVRDEIGCAPDNFFTIGLETLIISKAQYIRKVRKDQLAHSEKYRILGEFDRKHVVIGMERKDVMDIGAALLDHQFGKSSDEIDVDRLHSKMKQDWKLAKTVALNLSNMHRSFDSIAKVTGLGESEASTISNRLADVIGGLGSEYAARKSLLPTQWWEDVEDQRIR